jgi:hypothetical protein
MTVLSAKLFAGLAGLAFVIAVLGRVHVLPRANLWLTVANVSFGTFYTHLFIAVVCVVFSFAYFGIVRLMQHPLNQTTGLIGFFLVAVASVVWLSLSFLATSDSLRTHGLVIVLFAAIFSFILGVALSVANLAWVLLRS